MQLTGEKETLFITMAAKAQDYKSGNSILKDKKADEILQKIGLDETRYLGFGDKITVIRARQLDEWTKEFMNRYKEATVLYLGCGLDSRIIRLDPPAGILWFDVDYPEVIAIRKEFYMETSTYKMISSSVTETGWLGQVPSTAPVLIIAEGILEYLTEKEVRDLLANLTSHFKEGQMIFDVMNSFAIESGKKKLKETTGAMHKWAVDYVSEVDALNTKLSRISDLPLLESIFIKQLPFGQRLLLKFASISSNFKTMIRLLRYRF